MPRRRSLGTRTRPRRTEEGEEEERTSEDDLPLPHDEAIAAWWIEARKKLDPGRRYIAGAPWSIEGERAVLCEGLTRRRHPYAIDLAIRTRGQCQIETRALTSRQLSELPRIPRALQRAEGNYRQIL